MSTQHLWWYHIMNCDESNQKCFDQWNIIHIAALIPGTISSIACIFIIITAIKYHSILSNLSFAAQLPIFISICDLGFEISHGGDHLHNLIYSYVSENELCQLFGSMKTFFINCQTVWALATAIYLHKSIFKQSKHEKIAMVKQNMYLHISCWGAPTIILCFGFIFDVYGVEGPWCGIPDRLTDIFMVDIWMCITIMMLVTIYSDMLWKLYQISKYETGGNGLENSNERVKKAIRTIGLYPIAYLVQWLAVILYKVYIIPRTFGTGLWVVICGNCGGIFNLILYGPMLLNQIKREKQETNQRQIAIEIQPTPTMNPVDEESLHWEP